MSACFSLYKQIVQGFETPNFAHDYGVYKFHLIR